jgi:flagellar assembly protein FliH
VALEKTLNVTLEERREEILQSLLEEAVANLQTQTSVTLHVSPQDLPLARELVDQYRAAGPGRPELTIHVDEDLGPGGLRLESGDGMVDNSVASRFEQVRQILDEYQEAP